MCRCYLTPIQQHDYAPPRCRSNLHSLHNLLRDLRLSTQEPHARRLAAECSPSVALYAADKSRLICGDCPKSERAAFIPLVASAQPSWSDTAHHSRAHRHGPPRCPALDHSQSAGLTCRNRNGRARVHVSSVYGHPCDRANAERCGCRRVTGQAAPRRRGGLNEWLRHTCAQPRSLAAEGVTNGRINPTPKKRPQCPAERSPCARIARLEEPRPKARVPCSRCVRSLTRLLQGRDNLTRPHSRAHRRHAMTRLPRAPRLACTDTCHERRCH